MIDTGGIGERIRQLRTVRLPRLPAGARRKVRRARWPHQQAGAGC